MEPWVQQLAVGGLVAAVVGVAVAVGLFLALRWVFLWYWRVSEAVELLEESAGSLRAIHALLRDQRVQPLAPKADHGSTPARVPGGAGSAVSAA